MNVILSLCLDMLYKKWKNNPFRSFLFLPANNRVVIQIKVLTLPLFYKYTRSVLWLAQVMLFQGKTSGYSHSCEAIWIWWNIFFLSFSFLPTPKLPGYPVNTRQSFRSGATVTWGQWVKSPSTGAWTAWTLQGCWHPPSSAPATRATWEPWAPSARWVHPGQPGEQVPCCTLIAIVEAGFCFKWCSPTLSWNRLLKDLVLSTSNQNFLNASKEVHMLSEILKQN